MHTQCEKIYNAIATHPGITAFELISSCYAPKYTSRISEINIRFGYPIECRYSKKNYHAYFLKPGFPREYSEIVKKSKNKN
jgi:hypothetical protein